MKNKPWQFNLLATSFLLLIVSFPLQVVYLFETDKLDFLLAFRFITITNWAIILTLALQVPLLFKVNKILLITLPLSFFLVAYNNYIVGASGLSVSSDMALFSSLGFLLLLSVIALPSARICLTHPKKRWWLQKQRIKVKIPLKINYFRGEKQDLLTYDISESGAFLTGGQDSNWIDDLDIGSEFNFKIISKDLLYIKSSAKVIRKNKEEPGKPRGIGIEFLNLDKNQISIIKSYCA